MPAPLDAAALAEALRGLPAWSCEDGRLVRTVPAPGAATAELRRRVAAEADALDHHPVVEDVPGGTRFVVWTHSRDAVTALDPALAARVDAVVDALGLG